VLGQVLAARVQTLLAAEHAARVAGAASLRSRMVEALLVGDDALSALAPSAGELAGMLDAEAVIMAEGGRVAVHGAIDEAQARPLLQWLETTPLQAGLLALHARADMPPEVVAALGNWCGVLALRHDEVAAGWLVALRREQVETIAWGGRPEKHYVNGPLGPRLTPRGSFAEWRETVRDTAVPWSATDIEIGRQLLDELGRASAARHAELGRARNQMLAVLGHDLRTPLQTISVTSHILGRDAGTAKMGERLQNATGRMQRLVGEVLDMSRLQSGLGLGFVLREIDVAALVETLVDEVRATYAGVTVLLESPPSLPAEADPDRLAQVVGNLLSNARHHGAAGTPVRLELARADGDVVLTVANAAPPIAPEVVAQLFSPYKRQSLGNERNKGGLGLGLYIAQEIARGHGGTLVYAWRDPEVVFTMRWPVTPPAA
ncbi:MAG: histidine kinase, partial [Comamonadaceae bacterium]